MRALLPVLAAALLGIPGCATDPVTHPLAPRSSIDAHPRDLHALAFAPRGVVFATAGDAPESGSDEIRVWVAATGERRSTVANYKGRVASLAFSPDGKTLAVGGAEGRISLLDAETGAVQVTIPGRGGQVTGLSFSFDGKALVATSVGEAGAQVLRWAVTSGELRDTYVNAASPGIALSPEGTAAAWSVRETGPGLRIADLETRKERVILGLGLGPGDPLLFSPDGLWLAGVHLEDWSPLPNHCPYLYLVEVKSGKVKLRSPRAFSARRGLAISHDGKVLARGVAGGLQLWDLKALEVQATVREPSRESNGAELLVFSPDDRTLVSSDGTGRLLFWDLAGLLMRPPPE